MSGEGHELSLIFGDIAEDYELGRPNLPLQAAVVLSRLGVVPGARVLELAAGTGKLTRLLKAMNVDLTATEPSSGMRAVFRRVLPQVLLLDNSADKMPGSDSEWDVVIAADAFHWFDADATRLELLRILRPGGYAICRSSVFTHPAGWSTELGILLSRYRQPEPAEVTTQHGQWKAIVDNADFDSQELFEIQNEEVYDVDTLMAFIRSLHFVANLGEEQKRETLEAVHSLALTQAEQSDNGMLRVPFIINIAAARKLS